MIREAIILAGGLGTRLKETVPELPKCMAPVAGKPFLFYVINQLRMQGIEKFIFSLGYKHEIIQDYIATQFPTLDHEIVIEPEPLGTGGAIFLACQKAKDEHVLVANGDTLYKADVQELGLFHLKNNAETTLALKPMTDFDRYGTVEIDGDGAVNKFLEKKYCKSGNINGGIYILNVTQFLKHSWPSKFSFEKEYLERKENRIFAIVQDEYFIDIGIPEDFSRSQFELRTKAFDLASVDENWSLFLDRDGVINVDKEGSYIFNPEEFIFTQNGPAYFKKLSEVFKHIVVVTNQRGIGRGLMTEKALDEIHQKMRTDIALAGGRIDGIYYCTAINNDHPCRKPNPGMARLAIKDFPEIDPKRSIMVGNNPSDMQFGRNAGMYTVFIRSTLPDYPLPHPDIDLSFNSLEDFARSL
jgi:D-glycero-alpha-D-manno-heptose 1-phosphate guanylyltransferase